VASAQWDKNIKRRSNRRCINYQQHLFWKSRPLCVRLALCSEAVWVCDCADLAFCRPSRCACAYTCLWVLYGLWSCSRP